jgi:UDP-N-acetylglucosamine--N-acetylmuramyl-(pentapeptide) pyrophosphoryl-undecaprenol N-acetylglucosamine transferase
LLGIPTCIHEQNSIPGLANKLLGKFVDRVFLSIPGSESFFASGRTIITGNPVRSEILACRDQRAGKRIGPVLMVLGGSQGAHRLNSLVSEGLCNSKDILPEGFLVIHQTGRLDETRVRERYEKEGVRAEVAAFFSDMAAVYSRADLLVSRAGATSLAEICVLGIPSILVPFPYAADNHQEHNALMVVERGGAVMYREAELESSLLVTDILAIISDPARIARMGEKAQEVSFPGATDLIVRECLAMAASAGV